MPALLISPAISQHQVKRTENLICLACKTIVVFGFFFIIIFFNTEMHNENVKKNTWYPSEKSIYAFSVFPLSQPFEYLGVLEEGQMILKSGCCLLKPVF